MIEFSKIQKRYRWKYKYIKYIRRYKEDYKSNIEDIKRIYKKNGAGQNGTV